MGYTISSIILTYVFGLIVSGINLVLTLFHSLYIVDLETDTLHPIDFVRKANRLLIPEIIAQVVLFVAFVPQMRFFELMLLLPILSWHEEIKKIRNDILNYLVLKVVCCIIQQLIKISCQWN